MENSSEKNNNNKMITLWFYHCNWNDHKGDWQVHVLWN